MSKIQIQDYRDFWDVPRVFLVEYNSNWLLFDCQFSDEDEDYQNTYQIFLMPPAITLETSGSWVGLSEKAVRRLGEVPVKMVEFDDSRRQTINDAILARLI